MGQQTVKIMYSQESLSFLKKKGVLTLIFYVKSTIEQCLQIYDPKLHILNHNIQENSEKELQKELKIQSNLIKLNIESEINDPVEELYVSKFFLEHFSKELNNPITIEYKGFVKKSLRIKEITPIVNNICKV